MPLEDILNQHIQSMNKVIARHDKALSDREHQCCHCGMPQQYGEPHCTEFHVKAQKRATCEIEFDENVRHNPNLITNIDSGKESA